MRRRVVAHIPADVAERELKLGPGGLRDVEFAVQLLQLVHGRGDEVLRVAATLPALDALRDGGYVGRDDALSLGRRVQVPARRRAPAAAAPAAPHPRRAAEDAETSHGWPARWGTGPDARGDARAVFEAEWALHAREVGACTRSCSTARCWRRWPACRRTALRLTPARPDAGWRRWASPTRRRAAAHRGADRRAVPSGRAATHAAAGAAVRLRRRPGPGRRAARLPALSEALGATPWYLRLLRDEGAVASRLAYLLGTSRYVARHARTRARRRCSCSPTTRRCAPRDPATRSPRAMRESAARQDDPAAAVARRARAAPRTSCCVPRSPTCSACST